jgi:hypothetical protein
MSMSAGRTVQTDAGVCELFTAYATSGELLVATEGYQSPRQTDA